MIVIVLLLASPFLLLSSHSKLCTAAKVILLKLKLDHVPLFTQKPLMTCPFTQSKSWSPYNHLGWLHGFFFHYILQLFSNVSSTVGPLLTTWLKTVKHPLSTGTTHFSPMYLFPKNISHHYITLFYLFTFYCIFFSLSVKSELTDSEPFPFSFFFHVVILASRAVLGT